MKPVRILFWEERMPNGVIEYDCMLCISFSVFICIKLVQQQFIYKLSSIFLPFYRKIETRYYAKNSEKFVLIHSLWLRCQRVYSSRSLKETQLILKRLLPKNLVSFSHLPISIANTLFSRHFNSGNFNNF